MELVDGEDLATILRRSGPLPPRQAARIAAAVARALAASHARGLVHRDIKPGNVLIGRDGQVKVVDFGIARAIAEAQIDAPGTTLGSVHYFSPEQARGEPATAASDIYALGIVLYEMLTGVRPWEGDSAAAVGLARLSGPVPDPMSVRASVPPDLAAITRKALALDPDDRFASATAMADALDGAVSGAAVAAGAAGVAAAGAAAPVRVPREPVPADRRRGPGRRRGGRGDGHERDRARQPVRGAVRAVCLRLRRRSWHRRHAATVRRRRAADHAPRGRDQPRRLDRRDRRRHPAGADRLPRLPDGVRRRRRATVRSPAAVVVPNFVGQLVTDAQRVADQKGIVLATTGVPSDQPVGTILPRTSPSGPSCPPAAPST